MLEICKKLGLKTVPYLSDNFILPETVDELVEASKDGYLAYIVFVVQMSDVKYFTPNIERHKEFGEALSYAKSQGVNILAYECNVDETSIVATKEVLVKL